MQVTAQFGLKKSLERLMQLVFLSSNFFSTIEVENQLIGLSIDKKFSEQERKQLLTYFLDLVESLSLERIYLTQDPNNEFRYFYNGGF
jgi:hypothetical protein